MRHFPENLERKDARIDERDHEIQDREREHERHKRKKKSRIENDVEDPQSDVLLLGVDLKHFVLILREFVPVEFDRIERDVVLYDAALAHLERIAEVEIFIQFIARS